MLDDMIWDDAKIGFFQDSSSSYVEKLYFPTNELGAEVVNYELKVSIGGLVVKNWETQIYPRCIPHLNGKVTGKGLLDCICVVFGKDYHGFCRVNSLSRVISKIKQNINDSLVIFAIGFVNKVRSSVKNR